MLGKFIKIDDEQFPNPVPGTFNDALYPVENLFTSEDGQQLSNVVRLNRRGWSATFNCTEYMKNRIKDKCMKPSCTCVIDDISMSGRLRTSSPSNLVAGSEYTPETNGLWVVSVTFEEF